MVVFQSNTQFSRLFYSFNKIDYLFYIFILHVIHILHFEFLLRKNITNKTCFQVNYIF